MLARSQHWKSGLALAAVLAVPVFGVAQDRDSNRDDGWDAQRGVYTRLSPGTTIPVRLNQTIDVDRTDNRVYYGTISDDVMGNNGRVAIPRGARAELIVRVAPDNDLILDLESVVVSGQRYAVRSDPNRYESRRDNSLVGAIVGAVSGMQVQGRAVNVPRDSVVTFRLDRPLEMGVPDRGVDRDGGHYHDWYGGRGGQK